ncbi:kinase-like protein, partial [Tothia fuscella]
LVAKLGPGLDLTEAESIKFIQRHTSVPVPRVWNSYEKDGVGYILMEYVDGELLERVWGKMDQSTRNTILLELRDYIKQMRQIKPPLLTRIGSATGGPATDRRTMNAIKGGPFETEKDFNEWQLKQLVEGSSQLSRETYASMHKTDHEIVFSHGDLAFHNVIVHDGHVAAIIDWEYAGWYPEHWDFCK